MAEAASATEKAEAKVGKELAAVMPLSHPVETELDFAAREPDKVVPEADEDGADTPSGHALRAVGAPDKANPSHPRERVRGLQYRVEKYKKRWLS